VVACSVLHDIEGTLAPHDGISMEWFEDKAALQRYEAWQHTSQQKPRVLDASATRVIDVSEVVLRGAEWLQQHWQQQSVKLKHIALARRAHGLSPAELSARWREKAGTVGGRGQAPAIVIPDEAKGRAYIQNHPLPRSAEWRYDAINEVYFDDLEAMRARIAFFGTHKLASADADLFSETTFVAVSEHPVPLG
jgi:hypothetical protein